ncbi:unnamed protein product [Camellia sinensis]
MIFEFDQSLVVPIDLAIRLRCHPSSPFLIHLGIFFQLISVKVTIDVEQNCISVYNNGDGVPVEIHQEEGVYVPEMIFGHLLTSSNYDDLIKKTTGGKNGYGAKRTNIFSTEFVIETADGKRQKKYKQHDELRKDIEQLCMQQAGPGYLDVATRMHFQRTAGLEQEIESLKKKLTACTREKLNLQEELLEAYPIKGQLADLHAAEVSKRIFFRNMEAEKQVKFFQGCVASAFPEQDHSIMEKAHLFDGIHLVNLEQQKNTTDNPSTTTVAEMLKVGTMILTKQYRYMHSTSCTCTKAHLTEDAIFLIFQHLNWNPRLIAAFSCACKWFDDVAKRVLWKEFCKARAPKMMLDLQSSGSHSVDGNGRALGKLLIYCPGCTKGGLFNNIHIRGHFVYRTRFSRTSGKSFLLPQCRIDVLYVSNPCENLDQGEEGDVGFFRGVFKSFAMSKVRKMLISRGAKFHPTEVCPYCKAKLWSMLQAKMVPQSASCRLGSYEDAIEYYVCLNGHVLGICTLLPLSDSEASELEHLP